MHAWAFEGLASALIQRRCPEIVSAKSACPSKLKQFYEAVSKSDIKSD